MGWIPGKIVKLLQINSFFTIVITMLHLLIHPAIDHYPGVLLLSETSPFKNKNQNYQNDSQFELQFMLSCIDVT